MSKKQKQTLLRILSCGALWGMGFFLRRVPIARVALYVAAYALIGWDVLLHAARNIVRGHVFDENFLMALATLGAFALGDAPEAVAVMLFYQIGELFQSYAVGKSRQSIASLMDIRPDYANREVEGMLTQVDPDTVAVDDVIVIKAGERVPLDGVVLDGAAALNTAALTGESLPRQVGAGDDILSGCINLNGLLRVRVCKVYGESTVARILDLVENASSKKARAEQFITRFARYYTPVVVSSALLLALLPPLLLGGAWAEWVERALIFLVISCPCALVLSIPLSFFGGIGGASKRGILIKGSNHLEALARTEMVAWDKTGTLTHGTFTVTAVHPETIDEQALLEIAVLAETYSDHPISRSLRAAYHGVIDASRVQATEEIAGLGIRAQVDGKHIAVGNGALMAQVDASWHDCSMPGTIIHVAVGSVYAGHIVISDTLKPDAAQAIASLRAHGVKRVILLTGDTQAIGAQVANALGIDELHAQLLPADKVAQVEALLAQKSEKGKLAFVGDGINDAPVLARADLGIAMGGLGADAAIEAADIVIMDDKPSKIAEAIAISRKTMRIVRQNIVFALAVKALVLVLGAFGLANMWAAVFSDVGVSVLAILNAMRALRVVPDAKSQGA
ncbi:MAG: heavy metal translocating P-type ATPase [Clostridia bacterium]